MAVYPITLGLALVGEVFVVSGASPFAVLRATAAVLLLGILVAVTTRLVFGDRHRAGVAASVVILLLLAGADGRIAVLLTVALAAILMERLAARRWRRPLVRWHVVGRFLSAAVTILALAIGIQAVQAGVPGIFARAITLEAPFHASRSAPEPSSPDDPDIYLILLDGFARRDVLEDVFGASTNAFNTGLADREFVVSTRSRSNYAITVQTLASMFHMRPFQEIASVKPMLAGDTSRPAGAIAREAINDAPALQILRDRGYEIHAISSGWEEPALRQADIWIDTGELNEFELAVMRRSLLNPILGIFAPDLLSSQHRARIENGLRALELAASERSMRPRFIFGHVPSPHAPWVHYANGTPRTAPGLDAFFAETPISTGWTPEQLKEGYLEQVEWLSRRVLDTVDQILSQSERQPVIILFSDHGTWIGAHDGDIRRRFRTLLAARQPDGSALFPDRVSTVDLFPHLFNQLFSLNVQHPRETPSYMTGDWDGELREVPDPS